MNEESMETKFYRLLAQGIDNWNRWRRENPDVLVNLNMVNLEKRDLSSIDLSRSYLGQANFEDAILKNANLCDATLEEAILDGADLSGADLSRASLSGAKLYGSNLSKAILCDADLSPLLSEMSFEYGDKMLIYDTEFGNNNLSNANLTGADFSGTNLATVNFIGADLSDANFDNVNLTGANLKGVKSSGASFINANLSEANLGGADLSKAVLTGANLSRANLEDAKLVYANLTRANLEDTNLTHADLTNSQLNYAILVGTNFEDAKLIDCSVYGISAWNVQLKDATQLNLVITAEGEPTIQVDSLEIAQFIYLLLEHKKLRDVLDAVMKRGVLLLGRFRDGGLELLQAIASTLRDMKYLPIIFDFDRPTNRNLTETIMTLVGLSRFVIADLSGPSVANELRSTIPHFKVPFVPIIEDSYHIYSMFVDFQENDWVMPLIRYTDKNHLIELLPSKIVESAESLCRERQKRLKQIFNKE